MRKRFVLLQVLVIIGLLFQTTRSEENKQVETSGGKNETCEVNFYWDLEKEECWNCPSGCTACKNNLECERCSESFESINKRCETKSQILDLCEEECSSENDIYVQYVQIHNVIQLKAASQQKKVVNQERFFKSLRVRIFNVLDLVLGRQESQKVIVQRDYSSNYYFKEEQAEQYLEVRHDQRAGTIEIELQFSTNTQLEFEVTLIGPKYSYLKNFTLEPFRYHSHSYFRKIDRYSNLIVNDSQRPVHERLFVMVGAHFFSNLITLQSYFSKNFNVTQSVSKQFLAFLQQSLSPENPANFQFLQPLLLGFYALLGAYLLTMILNLLKRDLKTPLRFSSFILAFYADSFFNYFIPFCLLPLEEPLKTQYEQTKLEIQIIYATIFVLAVLQMFGKDPIFFEYFVFDVDAYSSSYKQDALKRYFHLISWILKITFFSYLLAGDRSGCVAIIILRIVYTLVFTVYKSIGSVIFKLLQSIQLLIFIHILKKLEYLDNEINTSEQQLVSQRLVNKFSLYDNFLYYSLITINVVALCSTIFNACLINQYFTPVPGEETGFSTVKQLSQDSLSFQTQPNEKEQIISFDIQKPELYENDEEYKQ